MPGMTYQSPGQLDQIAHETARRAAWDAVSAKRSAWLVTLAPLNQGDSAAAWREYEQAHDFARQAFGADVG